MIDERSAACVAVGSELLGAARLDRNSLRITEVLGRAGYEVVEKVLTFKEFEEADEVFLSGNMTKVTPVTAFDDVSYQVGPVTRRARELYWDWALSEA